MYFSDSVDFEPAVVAVVVELDVDDLGREFFCPGLWEDFEDSSSMFAAENLFDCFSLLGCCVLVDVESPDTVSLVYGLQPTEALGEYDLVQLSSAVSALIHY